MEPVYFTVAAMLRTAGFDVTIVSDPRARVLLPVEQGQRIAWRDGAGNLMSTSMQSKILEPARCGMSGGTATSGYDSIVQARRDIEGALHRPSSVKVIIWSPDPGYPPDAFEYAVVGF